MAYFHGVNQAFKVLSTLIDKVELKLNCIVNFEIKYFFKNSQGHIGPRNNTKMHNFIVVSTQKKLVFEY